jgi:hypothetical protein
MMKKVVITSLLGVGVGVVFVVSLHCCLKDKASELKRTLSSASDLVQQTETLSPADLDARIDLVKKNAQAVDVAALSAPVIEEITWGVVKVKKGSSVPVVTHKDCIVVPSGAYAWDWRTTNLSHGSGIAIADVKSLVNEADVFILSRGVEFVLQVRAETVDYLWQQGKEVYVMQSYLAAAKYNELVGQGKRVALLLHSTC